MNTKTQPNIVLFCGEDTGRHQGCYGDIYARTPNIDRLAREGCLFTNAFSTAPVCAPSRSAVIAGQFANKIGSHHMRSTLLDPPRLFTHELRDAGYFVNWATKTDFNFQPPDDFADARHEWIDALEAGTLPQQPFFLYYNFAPTHESALWPEGTEANVPAVEPPAAADEDPHALGGIVVPPYLPDTRETRMAIKRYYQRLEEQDAMLGRVLDALDKQGLADNTIVIYKSDHGRGLCREKRWLYEAGIHLPLVVRAPGLTTPGSIREDLVSWVDLAPTLCALAGAPIPEPYDGRVFLGPEAQPEPECVFAARDRMDECFDRVRAARDRRYLYLRNDFPNLPWAQRLRFMETSPVTQQLRERHASKQLRFPADLFMRAQKPAEELYDTAADPYCVHNLAGREDYAETLKRLRRATRHWCERIGDKGLTPERQLVEAGVVADRLTDYQERIKPLPGRFSHGGHYDSVLEEPGVA